MKDRLKEKMSLVEYERVLGVHFDFKKYQPLEFIEKYCPNYDGGNDYEKMINALTNFDDGFYVEAYRFKKIDAIYEILEFKTFYYRYVDYGRVVYYIKKPFLTTHIENDKVLFYQPFNIKIPPLNVASRNTIIKNFDFGEYHSAITWDFYDYPWTENYQEVTNSLHQAFELQRINNRMEIETIIGDSNNRYFDILIKSLETEQRFTFEVYHLKKIKCNNYICKMDTFILVKCKKEIDQCYSLLTVLRVYDGEIVHFLEFVEDIIECSSEKGEDFLMKKYYWMKKGFYEIFYLDNYNNLSFTSRKFEDFEKELSTSCDYIKIKFSSSSKIEDYLELYKYNYTKEIIEDLIWQCKVNGEIKYHFLIIKNKNKDYKLFLRREKNDLGIEVIHYITIEVDSETGEYVDLYNISYKGLDYKSNLKEPKGSTQVGYEEI